MFSKKMWIIMILMFIAAMVFGARNVVSLVSVEPEQGGFFE